MSDNIHVAVRMRPLISRERESKAAVHWKADGSTIHQTNVVSSAQFQFDRVFKGIDTNEIVYAEFCAPLVKSVIDGFNGTIFAYGQTSSGKTFTMMGNDDGKNLGIIHYTISDIFNYIQDMPDREFLLRVSYMEIYNEMVVDLLTNKSENLKLKEDKYGHIKVNGLTEHIVQEPDQMLELMRKGEKKRRVGETLMNERSSRSHSIFQVIIESGIRGDEDAAVNVSQFNLVDLAGSERARQTGAKGARLKESININKSLMVLSQVISQLSERVVVDQYINYRDSKITRILQNSLGGNARTAIICTVTPASLDETISTLKFATRAKSIKNKPEVNEVLTEQALLKRYANEIKKLTKELEATKEEKAQQNKNLHEQILSLRNKFVSQMAPKCDRRTARRETWGGCLDAARLRLSFAPQKLLSSLDVQHTNEFSNSRKSFTLSNRLSILDNEPTKMASSVWNNPLSDLPTVDEESEFDFDALETENNVFSRYSKCLPERPSSVPSYTDATAQTDMNLQPSATSSAVSESEKIKALYALIKTLENELAESREFTSLERQIMRARNRSSLGLDDDKCRNKAGKQAREILLTENGTPQRSDSRFSIGDESTVLRNESCLFENHSSTPLQSSSVAIVNSNVPRSEDKLSWNGMHLKAIDEIDLPFTKVGFEVEKLDSDKEELFLYLGDTIKILSKRTQINSASKTEKLNEQSKVLLNMFNMVLHYQCSKLNNNLMEDLSDKMAEISEMLNGILCHFSSQSVSHETMEDAIQDFMNKTDIFLKEIEMLSLDRDCGKGSIENQLMPIENSDEMHCFEMSDVFNTSAKSAEPLYVKRYVDNAMNTSIDYTSQTVINASPKSPELVKSCIDNAINTSIDYPQTVQDNLTDHNINLLETQITALEKDIVTHLKTISELKEDIDLKNEQVASFEDELLIQNEIIDCLKEELAVKTNEITVDKADENVCPSEGLGSKFMDCSCQTYLEEIEMDKTKEILSFAKSSDTFVFPETPATDLQTECDNALLQDKILTLENEIENNEKIISDLKYNKDLKDKQMILFKDKVQIQEQIIERLHEEISLNNTVETVSKAEPKNICFCRKEPVSLTSSSCQTFYLDSLSLYDSSEERSDECKLESAVSTNNVSVQCECATTKSFGEFSAHGLKSADIKESDSPHVEKGNSMDLRNMEASLNVTLKDLKELKQFTLEFMERSMTKEYFGEVSVPQMNKDDSSVHDMIKMETITLKEMLSRLEFYLKDKSESYEYFQSILENKAEEVLSLRRKFSDAESKLKATEAEDQELDKTLSDLENSVLILVDNFKTPRSLGWKDPIAHSSKNSNASKRILTLQKINRVVDFFAEEKNSLGKEAEANLAHLQKHVAIKLTKSVQTAEDVQLLKISEELKEFKEENEDLINDISNLKLKIEEANRAKEDMEYQYKEKETFYKKEIENLKSKFESDRCSWTANTLKCVKTVEEKCDQMIIDQENKFYDELDRINQQHNTQLEEKAKSHKCEMTKVVSDHDHGIVVLKSEHLKSVADIQDKLSKVIEERYSERTKLEDDINSLKREVFLHVELSSKFKQKCKQYAAEMQRLRTKTEKSTRDLAVQTHFMQSVEVNDKTVKSFTNKGTQSRTINFHKKFMESDFCAKCILILQPHLQEGNAEAICCKRLQNELETKKAKIMSLTRNNETLVKETVALNKELSSKMILLRNCQCRVAPKVIGNHSQAKTVEKRKESHRGTDQNGETKSSELRKEIVFPTEADVLKSDLVQRALERAVEEERVKLSGSGAVNLMTNCMLKRQLNLKDKELRHMEKELAELKTYPSKRNAIQANENQPVRGSSDFEEKDFTSYAQAKHPYPLGAVPKLQAKNILKERNKASQPVNNPLTAKTGEKDAVDEKPVALNPPSVVLTKALPKKAGRNHEKKDVVEETKRQLELFSSGEPECKQQ